MKKASLLFVTILLSMLTSMSQTPKQVNAFPEEYIGKSITFKNIRYWPILDEYQGYYSVQIDVASSLNNDREWGFASLHKIKGVVEKDIAKQMINKAIGGYNKFYYGTVTGIVIKNDKVSSSAFLFVITKIINHPPDEPNSVVNVFQKTK
jgi:hypothetical protein